MTPKATNENSWLLKARVPDAVQLPELHIPRRYALSHVDDINNPGLRACVLKYGKEFWNTAPKGIAPLFAGQAGTGKTYAASVIARAVHTVHRIPVAWCNCAEELVWFDREAFSSAVQTRLTALKTAPFLVLDDFTQFQDGRQLNTLGEIGSARYNAMLPTLWTGNVTIKKGDFSDLERAVGVMLARRIVEMSEGVRIMVKTDA